MCFCQIIFVFQIKWGIEKVLQHDITTGELYFLIDWSPSICSKRTEKLIKKSKFKKNVYMIYPLNGQFVQIYWSPNWEPLENVETDINM